MLEGLCRFPHPVLRRGAGGHHRRLPDRLFFPNADQRWAPLQTDPLATPIDPMTAMYVVRPPVASECPVDPSATKSRAS